jgi:hypothetical protein
LPKIDFLKEKLVEAEKRVRFLEAEVAEAAFSKEKIRELEIQLSAAETDKAKIIADMMEDFHGKLEKLSGDLVIIFQTLINLPFFSA